MSVVDKNQLLSDIEERLNAFIPANTVKEIISQTREAFAGYDIIALPGGPDDEGRDLIRLFLDAKESEGKSEKTIARYKYILERLQKDTGVPLAKMTVYHLRSYLMSEKDRGISPGTLEGNRSVYSAFYGWLRADGLIDKDPTANLAPVKRAKEVRKPFTDVEVMRLMEKAKSPRDAALISFLLATGCRVGEVCGINRSDVNLHEMRMTVVGKGNKERIVYFDEVTAMWIERYLKTRRDFSPALFAGRQTDRMTPGGVRAALNKIAEEAGVGNVQPHRFRRTRATNLIDHGMPIQEVAAVLGHDKLDTTMKYVYVNQRNVENSYRKYA